MFNELLAHLEVLIPRGIKNTRLRNPASPIRVQNILAVFDQKILQFVHGGSSGGAVALRGVVCYNNKQY
jgi:hypothetical protein